MHSVHVGVDALVAVSKAGITYFYAVRKEQASTSTFTRHFRLGWRGTKYNSCNTQVGPDGWNIIAFSANLRACPPLLYALEVSMAPCFLGDIARHASHPPYKRRTRWYYHTSRNNPFTSEEVIPRYQNFQLVWPQKHERSSKRVTRTNYVQLVWLQKTWTQF